tara:strand:- start:46 stop:387 length:342 start_codon:yes stop_codon:yes gene_type:complete
MPNTKKKKSKKKVSKKKIVKSLDQLSARELKKKTNKFADNFYTAIGWILKQDGVEEPKDFPFTYYALQMMMVDNCLYNDTTSPFFLRYAQELENDQDLEIQSKSISHHYWLLF